jgi:hypothetical protein
MTDNVSLSLTMDPHYERLSAEDAAMRLEASRRAHDITRQERDEARAERASAVIAHRLAAKDRDGARRLCAEHERRLAEGAVALVAALAGRDTLLAELDAPTPDAALARIRAERAELERMRDELDRIGQVWTPLSLAREAIETAEMARRGGR